MDIGHVVLKLRSDGVGICSALTNVGNDDICVNRKFSLEEISWQRSSESGGTHVEHMKDLVEFQPPGDNCHFIVLRVEISRDYVPFTPLDDVPLNLGHNPAIESPISASPGMSITGPTHVLNCSIASNTD